MNLWLKLGVQSAVRSIFKLQGKHWTNWLNPPKAKLFFFFFFGYSSQWAVLFSLFCHSVNCESSQDPTADTSCSALCHRILSDKKFCVFQIIALSSSFSSSTYIHLLPPFHQFFFFFFKSQKLKHLVKQDRPLTNLLRLFADDNQIASLSIVGGWDGEGG